MPPIQEKLESLKSFLNKRTYLVIFTDVDRILAGLQTSEISTYFVQKVGQFLEGMES